MKRHAAIVTIDDIDKYFSGVAWKSIKTKDFFETKSDKYHVNVFIKPFKILFNLHVEAIDDPSDSTDEVTYKPIDDMAEFLNNGISFISSVSPESVISQLKCASVEMASSRHIAARRLRRLVVNLSEISKTASLSTLHLETDEIKKLKHDMEKKGWKVQESKTEFGMPELSVDISGVYKANISVDSIQYDYTFEVPGFPDSKESGTTNDPIHIFEEWSSNEDIENILEIKKSTQLSPESREAPTTPPKEQSESVEPPTMPKIPGPPPGGLSPKKKS